MAEVDATPVKLFLGAPGISERALSACARDVSLAGALEHPNIVPVTDAADLERIAVTKSAVFGDDWSWLVDDLGGRLRADPESITVLMAEAGTEVISSAWIVFNPDGVFAGLWGGSTAEAWRGRGIYRALVARRAQLAAERGYRYLQVDALETSRPILERLGFVAVTRTTPYIWTPPALRSADADR